MTLTTLRLSDSGQKVTFRAKGAGEPLVFVHGVGMQSAAWAPQMRAFAADHRVIAIDMPGHGGSDPLPVASQLPDFVAWCAAVIRDLGLGPVNLVGHSMGALIAGGVAACHPEMIQRVALLNGVFQRDHAAKAAVQARAADISRGHIDVETPLARWFDPDQQQARALVADWLSTIDQAGYATAYTAFAQGDDTYAEAYSTITCPFLSMTGDGDPNSTPVMTRAMADLVADGCAVTIDGHRHMINLTAADQVNAHLSTWLKRPSQTKALQ